MGEILGTEMLFKCPDVMMSLVEEFSTDEVSMVSTSGTISQIIEGPIIIFELTTPEGMRQKLYWFTFIKSEFDLQKSYKDLMDKQVTIEYIEEEIFDPRIAEYRKFSIISALQLD